MPVAQALVWIDSLTDQALTDGAGRFYLAVAPSKLPAAPNVTFVVNYSQTTRSYVRPTADLDGNVTLDLGALPIAGALSIVRQPPAAKSSVSTFDLVVRNFGTIPASAQQLSLQLAVRPDACKQGLMGASKVDDVAVFDLARGDAVSGDGSAPIHTPVRAWHPYAGNVGCVNVVSPLLFDVAAPGAYRLRIDVRSSELKRVLTSRFGATEFDSVSVEVGFAGGAGPSGTLRSKLEGP